MAQLPYTDLSTVKAFLSIADTDTSQDAFLASIIPMVQTFIERYTGRTFGWGDEDANGELLDDPHTDYSNSDGIAITAVPSLNGTALTVSLAAPAPWVVGNNVSLYGGDTAAYNGVWKVAEKPTPVTLVLDLSTSAGTLSGAAAAMVTSGNGYVGNFVSNYLLIQQEQYDGTAGREIWLRNMDIRSIQSVYLGLRNVATPTLLPPTNYLWRDDGRFFIGGSYFNAYDSSMYANEDSFYGSLVNGFQTLTISYYCGYVGVPPEIQLAATDLVMAYAMLRKGMGLNYERVGDYQVGYDMQFRKLLQSQPDALNTLNIWRRRKV